MTESRIRTYAISLKTTTRRYEYITQHLTNLGIEFEIINAVDGRLLSDEDKQRFCDMEEVNKIKWWLNDGAIGCALSHLKAYQEFLKTENNFAFIVEEDVVLPNTIKQVLDEVASNMDTNDIVLLYYASFEPARFSSKNIVSLSQGGLYYPMDIRQTITATAYIIGKQAAANMSNAVIPIRVTADTWHYYFDKGCFRSLRVHLPVLVETKNFKSTIGYFEKGSLKHRISDAIEKYKIPLLYQFAYWRRKRMLNTMLHDFELVDEVSPLDKKTS